MRNFSLLYKTIFINFLVSFIEFFKIEYPSIDLLKNFFDYFYVSFSV